MSGAGAGAEKRECRPRRTARCRRGCMPGVCASRPGSRTQNGSMHQPPPTAKIRSGHKRTSGTPLLGRRRLHTTMRRAPPEAAPAGCRPGRRRMSALAGCGSAGYNGGAVQSHAGCRVQVVHRQRLSGRFPCVGRFPMANSQNPIHTDTPDDDFYSAAPGMIFDTARKKHSARPHIPPQSAGGDEKRPITLRGNFLTGPLSAR